MVLILRNDFITLKHFLANVEHLEDDQRIYFSLYRPTGNIVFPKKMDNSIYEAPKILNILLECLNILNENFGTTILLFNLSTVLNILMTLNQILISEDLEQLDAEKASNSVFEFVMLVVSSIISNMKISAVY